ncbi:dihydrofolate reductase family protein [Nocardioides sp. MH1]|uniref:dihydrofolate reductase family protein n=1 Tax=Nocardioides sp. MH1 TaxID=3242490 RepID=UPI0035221C17
MAELMVDVITSLDGFSSAEGWPGLWGLGGPDYFAWLAEDGARARTTLMGATTYRLFTGFVESGEEDLSDLTALDKVVFSSTLDEPLAWANTRLVRGDAVEAVRAMKQDGETPLRTIGSLSLCRALVAANLVDRFRVVVFPVVTGASGREHFYTGWPDIALETIDHRTFDGRLQLMEFVPTVLDRPPTSSAAHA